MKGFFFLFISTFVMFGATSASVEAQTIPSTDLTGFAWSSNIGWISLNCEQGGATGNDICGTSNYKVTINADRSITGFAWSSNIGWVKFGGLSNFPVGGGTAAENARVSGTYPDLTWNGWARACAGTQGGTCSTMVDNPEAGSWDGWIALRGTNHSVTANMLSGMNTDSYAWGSDVVGWVDMFSRVGFSVPQATISGNGCTITTGSNSCAGQLSWNIDAAITGPNVYRVSPALQLTTNTTGNNFSVTLPFGNTTFQARSNTTMLSSVTLSAACDTGLTHNGSACVSGTSTTSPAITLGAVPPFVRMGNTATIAWTVSDPSSSTCVLNGPGLVNVPVTTVTGSQSTGPIRNTTTVRLTCSGGYGSVEERTTIEVIPTAEEV